MSDDLNHIHVARVTFLLTNGVEETWEFDPNDRTALYRISSNYHTAGKGSSTILEQWKEHTLQWTSNRMRPQNKGPKGEPMELLPDYDSQGRALGTKSWQASPLKNQTST